MRLDKITIGSPEPSPAHRFKNLKDVTIEFDQHHWVTVVIGWNGTGKSNVLEALATIFRELIGPRKAPKIDFAFKLSYRMGAGDGERRIEIDHDPDRASDKFIIFQSTKVQGSNKDLLSVVDGAWSERKQLRLKRFLDEDGNLPRYVFSYYSGESTRMYDIFSPYLKWYDEKLRRGRDPGLKRLFYALPVHSQFVLLAFIIHDGTSTDYVREFLNDHLGIDPSDGLESVLFVLRQPPWANEKRPGGDPRFWGAAGVVSRFLSRLFEISLAPTEATRSVAVSPWNSKTLQFKYLYVKNMNALRELVGEQKPAEFFRDLESTYVSQLIDEVRIKVKLRKNDGTVTFREMSEGEQQLLTVLGLLKFTAEDESLFLLDEPDTHLNPRWSVDYLSYLTKTISESAQSSDTSHILLTTHNPLAIAELVREQVQILHLDENDDGRRVVAFYPETDPRGMGYAAIVASDMFGIASTLDQPTQILLEKQRILGAKKELDPLERRELDETNAILNKLGFRFFHPDDEYSRYLRIRNEMLSQKFPSADAANVANSVVSLTREERENLAKELIDQLLAEV